ncbi:hypothetical protein ABT352_32920 [Streptosporangium sp. NPDC000563]|uniref:hypothetical protein n=1 Tax=Streptosporangium sp. NPDC000563 TaxID=3154366 RepID=UPI00332C2076
MTPAEAAARAARKNGVFLYDEVAAEIARAVLEAHDTVYQVREAVPKEVWAAPDAQTHIRRGLRKSLMAELADKELLPVALPTESLRYLAYGYWMTKTSAYAPPGVAMRAWADSYVGDEVPANLAETDTVAWETVEVTLTVPVREATA